MFISTDGVPPSDRLAFFRELSCRMPDPVDIRVDDVAGFSAWARVTDFGSVTLADFTATSPLSIEVRRGPKLIRQSDPESYCVLITMAGVTGVAQGGRDATLRPGDIGLHDSSRPLLGWRKVDNGPARIAILSIPRRLLPVHSDKVKEIAGARLPGSGAIPTLVRTTVRQLADGADEYAHADAARLSAVVVDLIAVLLAHALEADDVEIRGARQRTLMLEIQRFVEQRLGDDLSPAEIAAAHHIGLRTLHRLFREHGLTVAGWIRGRRLEQCKRDLADPRLADCTIDNVARRWGFADAAHLSHAFKHAYGASPGAWRAANRESTTAAFRAPAAVASSTDE